MRDLKAPNNETVKLIKSNLLQDLSERTGLDTSTFEIDFSNELGEGSEVEYNGQFLENASGIGITDANLETIGGGWVDHIVDNKNKLYSFWTILDFNYNDIHISDNYHGIPQRVWEKLSEEDKFHLANTFQGWIEDDNLREYRRKVYPKKLMEFLNLSRPFISAVPNLKLAENTAHALSNLVNRVESYLSGKKIERQHTRDLYQLEEDVIFKEYKYEIIAEYQNPLDALYELEYLLDRCLIISPILPQEFLLK